MGKIWLKRIALGQTQKTSARPFFNFVSRVFVTMTAAQSIRGIELVTDEKNQQKSTEMLYPSHGRLLNHLRTN